MIELPFVFLAGLLGSSHCVGMCGGFALTIGSAARLVRENLWRQTIYSAGRVFTYTWLGICAAYGGMVAGAPNPTGALGVQDVVDVPVVNIPGCPAHPDWIVGAIAYVLANGAVPPLDRDGRPKVFFGTRVHDRCPNRDTQKAHELGEDGCLNALGCNGPNTKSDCPTRMWNAGGPGEDGVNWCVGAGSPCYGCTEPSFPDSMTPFYKPSQTKSRVGQK